MTEGTDRGGDAVRVLLGLLMKTSLGGSSSGSGAPAAPGTGGRGNPSGRLESRCLSRR
ncbi:hypothetical protein [Streptomyces sp. NPDC020597]|uniref:hypothetical protein n=1 Tax=unclassified Streptomyces TaxID=2593676 RepID=UPI0037A3D373